MLPYVITERAVDIVIIGRLILAETEFTDPALGEDFRKMKSATEAIQSRIEFTELDQDLGSNETQWQELDKTCPVH